MSALACDNRLAGKLLSRREQLICAERMSRRG
jgi:hypothetical protein